MASCSLALPGSEACACQMTLRSRAALTASHSRCRDHAHEIALAHHAGAGNVLDRALVDAERLGAGAVGALPARTHDAAVQHAGYPHVLHVGVFGADLVGKIEARHPSTHQLVLADRLARCSAGEREMQLLIAEKIAVPYRPARIAGDRDDAIRYRQVGNRRVQPRCGEPQQNLPRFRRRRAQLRSAALDRGARGGGALVRGHVCVEPHRRERPDVEIELFAGDLQHAGGVALPELALAENDGGGVVGVHRDPGIDQLGIGRTAGLGAGGRRPGEAEADDERAAALEESAARKGLGGERVGHDGAHGVAHGLAHGVAPGAAAAMTRDASLIAFITRG